MSVVSLLLCSTLLWANGATSTSSLNTYGSAYNQVEIDFRRDESLPKIFVQDQPAEDVINRVLAGLGPLQSLLPFDFKIIEDGEMRGDRLIRFVQLTDGVPVSVVSDVRLKTSGEVVKVLVAKTDDVVPVVIDSQGAWQIAEAALLARLETNQLTLRLSSSRPTGKTLSLSYHPNSGGAVPHWEVHADIDNSLSLLDPDELQLLSQVNVEDLPPAIRKKIQNGQNLVRGTYYVVINANSGEVLGMRQVGNRSMSY